MTLPERARLFFRRPVVLHPFLFGFYLFVVTLPYLRSLSVPDLALTLALLELTVLLLALGLTVIFGDKRKGSIFLTVMGFPVMFYDQFEDAIRKVSASVGRMRYVLPLYLAFMVLFTVLIVRTKKPLKHSSNYLSALMVCLMAYSVVVSLAGSLTSHAVSAGTSAVTQRMTAASPWGDTLPRTVHLPYQPDVYYLLFDGYTSSESLAKYWGYDNSGFEKALESRGFVICRQSKCLYPSTVIAMTSTFNMIDDMGLIRQKNPALMRMINRNAVFMRMKELGYRTVNKSIFDIYDQRRTYKVIDDLSEADASGFQSLPFAFHEIGRSSLPVIFTTNLAWIRRAQTNLDILRCVSSVDLSPRSPLFLYAHVMTPHLPGVFDRNGNTVPVLKLKNTPEAYLDQVMGTNILITRTVDSILKRYPADQSPVIFIQGDHGFRSLANPADRDVEKYTLFNACLFPGGGTRNLYPAMSPYNTFRLLFDTYFAADYPLLPDYR